MLKKKIQKLLGSTPTGPDGIWDFTEQFLDIVLPMKGYEVLGGNTTDISFWGADQGWGQEKQT